MKFNPCCQKSDVQRHQNANRNQWLQCEHCSHWLSLPATCTESQAVTLWNDDVKPSYEALEAKVASLSHQLQVFLDIVSDSQGVAGYHLNGDVAEWDELLDEIEGV